MKDQTLKDIVVEICKIVKTINMKSTINPGGLFNRTKVDMLEVLKAIKSADSNAMKFCNDNIEREDQLREAKEKIKGLVEECDQLRETLEEKDLSIDNQGIKIKDLEDANRINSSSVTALTTKNKHQFESIKQYELEAKEDEKAIPTQPVSYTHLTLPTKA